MAQPLRLSTTSPTFEADFKARLHWSADTDAAIEQRVADILADVQQRGDAAVLAYTERFDGLKAPNMAALELTQAELKAAFESLPTDQRDALHRQPRECAATTKHKKRRVAKAGPTAMPMALCWAKKSHRSTVWAFMCPVAKRPTHRAC